MQQALTLGLMMAAAMSACGQDTQPAEPDAPSGNHPPPRVIAGGGIGDGPIDGVANLYVIDDVTRQPIRGAAVRVGTLDGTTDAEGLFVAKDVVGPQTVSVKAGTYRSEVWIGANGANLTMNLVKANLPSPVTATLTGQITGFGAIAVPPGHAKDAVVFYSQTKDLGAPENELDQQNLNACYVRAAGQDCTFTVTSRTGTLALVAVIFDRDLKGTPGNFDDDVLTVKGYAHRGNITATAGANAGAFDLTPITGTQSVTVDLGAVPAYFEGSAAVSADLGDAGFIQLAFVLPASARTVLVPRLDAIGASAYQLVGIATRTSANEQTIVVRRGLTGTTLAAGEWLAVPGDAAVSATGGSWTNAAGATVHALAIEQGKTRIANLTIFDGSTSARIPDLIAIPTGSLTVAMNAVGAPGLVVTDFALDRDRDKLVQLSGKQFTITR